MNERLREALRLFVARLRRLRWRRIAGISGVGLLLALVSFVFSFPLDSLLEYASREAATKGVQIRFADAGVGVLGPWVENLDVEGPVRLHVDHLTVRPRVQTLWGDTGISFVAGLGGGEIRGHSAIAAPVDLAIDIDDVRLAESGLTSDLPLGLSLDGQMSGRIAGVISPAPDEITGTVELTVADPVLHTGALPLPVSAITGSKLKLRAEARNGNLEISPLSLDGSQVWGTVRGTIQLERPAARSRAKLTARIHFDDQLNAAVGPLLPMAGFRQERDAWVRQYNGMIGALVRRR